MAKALRARVDSTAFRLKQILPISQGEKKAEGNRKPIGVRLFCVTKMEHSVPKDVKFRVEIENLWRRGGRIWTGTYLAIDDIIHYVIWIKLCSGVDIMICTYVHNKALAWHHLTASHLRIASFVSSLAACTLALPPIQHIS